MDDIKPIFDRVRWRFRVWAWRLAILSLVALVPLAAGCAHRQRIQLADTIGHRCISAIAAAPTLDEARAIADACVQRLDAIEQEQRR